MISTDNKLFHERELSDILREQLSNAQKEVDKITKRYFQSNSDDQIIQHIYSKMEILPLEIQPEAGEITEPQETKIKDLNVFHDVVVVKGVGLEYSLPYHGNLDLWRYRPSTYNFNPPCGYVYPDRLNDLIGIIKIKFFYPDSEFKPENVKAEIDKAIERISEYLAWSKKDVLIHDQQILVEIERLVKQRSDRLGGIQATIEALEIPIKRREGVPEMTQLPIKRKIITPLAGKQKSDPEYGISSEVYGQILKVIRHEGATFERTPSTFAVHNEEELRDILLAHLNGHFEGRAAGEAFRKKGKTDISIEFNNRAAFVAECKIWSGDKKILEAVDQLLGYLTWRDVKTALIIFNKDVAGFTNIQEKLPEIFKTYANFVGIGDSIPGEWRLRVQSADDEKRIIEVHVFLFNLFTNK
jgi:hypothetical protein